MTYISLACRCVCCLVFAASAYGKLHSKPAFREFISWIASLPAVPARARMPLAVAIAASEVCAIAAIVIPRSSAAGLVLATCLFAVFGVGMLVILRSKPAVGCNCFGPSTTPVGIQHVLRDAALCAIAATGIASLGPRASDPAGVALAVGTAIVIAALLVFLDELGMVFAGPRREPSADLVTRE
jgi:methylamine utilization protein MauE